MSSPTAAWRCGWKRLRCQVGRGVGCGLSRGRASWEQSASKQVRSRTAGPGAWGCGPGHVMTKPTASNLCRLLFSRHCIKWPQIWFEFKFQMPGKPTVPRKPLSGTQSIMTSLRGLPSPGEATQASHIHCFMTNSEPCILAFILIYP